MAFWEDGQFVLENYLTKKQTIIAPVVAQLLQNLNDYVPRRSVLERFGSIPSAEQLFDRLVAQDVLVAEGTSLDQKESLLEKTWRWGNDARFFHYVTQDVPFETDPRMQREFLVRLTNEESPPCPYKDYGRLDIQLVGSFLGKSGEFWDALRKRRTRRSFARQAISFRDFSTILLWTWGKTHFFATSEIGPYILKTSPSGGARHSIEVYPVVLRVEGIEPGIYHYSVRRHGLERLRPGSFDDLVVRLFANQAWVRDAAAVFLMTAIVERSMWKYHHSHAYRVLLLDAGHLGQTFHLVCTELGLAPFTSAGLKDTDIEVELGLNGISEIPLYAAATGILANARS